MLPEFDSYYRRVDEHRYQPSIHVQGAWQDSEQHMAPVSGLLTHCLESHRLRPELQLSRISFEILGMIAADVCQVEVETVRAGRTIELIEARLSVAGRVAVRAGGWRIARGDTSAVAGSPQEPSDQPSPEDCEPWAGSEHWPGGYIRSIEVRRGTGTVPGRARAWLRTQVDLVEDTDVSDLARFVGLVDTANGIGARVDPRRWMFPNLDLGIHLFRTPSFADPGQRWVGFDTRVDLGTDGVGLTSSILHDRSGPVGRAEQILTVRPLPVIDDAAHSLSR